ncbi:hypothetical protein T265_03216 [Opisthorchis viverrini]|uniref:Uncharacterized protein n=2 Tax=Opisthorchis viverrini TaxID=6198 RepID=A0A074ZSI2_OPIVI|nr:hypothetical protein T265_03216 [Opisthorchis viverrini]KER30383.1 hypothetical protein T265_03216 [Opisthorchis viverrini]
MIKRLKNRANIQHQPGALKHWMSGGTVSLLKSRRNIPAGPEHNPMRRAIRRQVKVSLRSDHPNKGATMVASLSPTSSEGDFTRYSISLRVVRRLQNRGIKELFPVQYKTFDMIMAGADVVVLARTGTGKTLAFTIPITEMLLKNCDGHTEKGRSPKVVILAPTRELVTQISSDFQSLCEDDFSVLAVYGGVPLGPQCNSLRRGVDVLVGTPGRVIDLMERGVLCLDSVKHVVLDEVDRMLDMGFHKDVESIIAHMYESESRQTSDAKPQTLLFSATMPPWVSSVAKRYLSDDTRHVSFIEEQQNKTALNVTHLALPCPFQERAATLADVIRTYCTRKKSRCIVFCERKKDADELAAHSAMSADCHVFHGDVPQDKRELILQKFREGKYRTLITTNVAARGLDIPEVDLVVQCHPPRDVEDYIHRSGRTGRAEKSGTSIVFHSPRERGLLAMIEQRAGIKFRRIAAPTLHDIIGAWGGELVQSFTAVPESTWSAFLPIAKRLVRELGAHSETEETNLQEQQEGVKSKKHKCRAVPDENESPLRPPKSATTLRVLCCALARLSGKDSVVETRSLLTSRSGFTTYKLEFPMVAHRKGLAYDMLRGTLSEDILNSISNMTFIEGRKGVVFDLPTNFSETVSSNWKKSQTSAALEVLTELPELEHEDNSNEQPRSRFNGGNTRGQPWRGSSRGWRGGRGGGGPTNRLSFPRQSEFGDRRGQKHSLTDSTESTNFKRPRSNFHQHTKFDD